MQKDSDISTYTYIMKKGGEKGSNSTLLYDLKIIAGGMEPLSEIGESSSTDRVEQLVMVVLRVRQLQRLRLRQQLRIGGRRGDRRRTLLFDQTPHIPGADRPIRPPTLANLLHLRRPGELLEPVEELHALADAEVAGGQHVGAVEGEDHEHVHRPGADPFHHGEHGEEGAVIHGGDGVVGEDAAAVLGGEVVEVAGLAGRDADLAELVS